MNNKILIILGMHRSGTSLISRWLKECGLNIGDRLVGADIGNEDGHFEDADFVKLHQNLLSAHNLSDTGLTDETVKALTPDEYKKLFAILELKSSLHEEWGWKDPRTCMFLENYRNALPHAKYIVILRDYHTVVNSLITRDFKKMEYFYLKRANLVLKFLWRYRKEKVKLKYHHDYTDNYLKVWINYNQAILDHLQTINENDFILVNYHMMIDADTAVCAHLMKYWGFTLIPVAFSSIFRQQLITASHNVKPFIKEEQLIGYAENLLNALKEYDFWKALKKNQQEQKTIY